MNALTPLLFQSSGPLLRLISSGLQLWIRRHCSAAKHLQLTLQGTTLSLLRGQLEGVILKAQGVTFQDLPISQSELHGGSIRFDLNFYRASQTLQIKGSFTAEGYIALTGQGLSQALLSPNWCWLGNQLAEQLLGLRSLRTIVVDSDFIELRALAPGQKELTRHQFRVWAENGTINLQQVDASTSMALPMDPNIRIDRVVIAGGQLYLYGHALFREAS